MTKLIGVLFAVAGSWTGAFAQLVYVPNTNDSTISAFVINTDAGTLTEVLPRVKTLGRPMAVAVEPKGKFLYVASASSANSGPNVASFTIDSNTGALKQFPGATFGLPAGLPADPAAVTLDPAGKFVYAASQNGQVVGYSINASTGALTRVPNTPSAAGTTPWAVTVDPAGKFVFVANQKSNNVSAYTIDSATGALTAVAGSPFAAGTTPNSVTVAPSGKFLIVPNWGGNNVSVYTIASSTGALAPVSGSPFASGKKPSGAAVDAAGKFVYVSNGADDNVSAYTLDANSGALAPVSGSPFPTQQVAPYSVAVDPTGKFLYTTNTASNGVSGHAIDPATGALSPVPGSPFATGANPQRIWAIQLSPPVPPPPVATSVFNAASYAVPGLPNYGIAPGSLFVVQGKNLGPAVPTQAASFPLATQLAGFSVKVTVGNVATDAIPVSASTLQLTALLPSSTPLGDGTLTVTSPNGVTAPVPIRVVSSSFGIYTQNQAGIGPAVALNYNSDSDQPPNSLFQAAAPGQVMILQGTGLGAVSFDETIAPPPQDLDVPVEVLVGNEPATVLSKGRNPQSPGADQIKFQLPDDVREGCYVSVVVRAAGVVSNFATISISSTGNVCSDAHGLAAKDLAALAAGGSLNVGWIQALRLSFTGAVPGLFSGTITGDTGWADLFRWNSTSSPSELGLDMFTGRATSLGSCSVYAYQSPVGRGFVPRRAKFLDAGPTLNLTGPKGAGQLFRKARGDYEHTGPGLGCFAPSGGGPPGGGPLFGEPCTLNLDNGSGGTDVGPLKATLAIPGSPTPLTWTNLDTVAAAGIDRSTDLTITWTGGDAGGEYVVIAGAVFQPGLPIVHDGLAAAFVCTEAAGAGQFTVPSIVLSALPASTPGDPTAGLLSVGRSPLLTDSMRFTTPGLDFSYFTNAAFELRLAAFQ